MLKLSPRRFWFLLNQVGRLRAEAAIQQLQVLGAVNSTEGFEKTYESLQAQIGQIYVWTPATTTIEERVDPETGLDPEFDRAALHALKAEFTSGR